MSKIITRESVGAFIFAFLLAVGASVFAWTGPTQDPPEGNVAAPLNLGVGLQEVAGDLWASSIGSDNGICIGVDCITAWSDVDGPWTAQGSDLTYSDGNIGIATTSPGYSLSVGGTMYTTGGVRFPDGTTQTTASIAFSCPAGFTLIQSQGRNLGCIQNNEQGTGVLGAAIAACFSTYGGRLPSFDELFIAFSYYALTAEADDHEMTQTLFENSGYKAVTLNGATIGSNSIASLAYRCFIPAS